MHKTGFLLTLTVFASVAFSQTTSAMDCADATAIRVPGLEYTAQATQNTASVSSEGINIPSHCRLEGAFEQRTGSDGVDYAIRFVLALPDDWNGRFLFQGGGGLNGILHEPWGARFSGETTAISRGFAVVSTDSGHQANMPFDATFMADQQALLNFLYRANEKVTVLAKTLIASYYDRTEYRSYFVGCSTGGREAMMMSQRYPTFFDGIVAGAPAMRTNLSELGDTWVAAKLRTAPSDGVAGQPLFDEDSMQWVVNGLMEQCDALDGLRDNMIFNATACDFDPTQLVCRDASSAQCLSAEQAQALTAAFAGPSDSRGYPIYSPFPFDGGIADGKPGGARAIPGLLRAVGGPLSARLLGGAIDWDAEAAKAAVFPLGFGNTSEFVQLDVFRQHGGKLIFYHGVSDPWFSSEDTVRYYQTLGSANGGADAVNRWSRLFLSPGVGHCAGGTQGLDQVDLLDAIVKWVEHDQAPDRLTATGDAFPGRARPLCAYPAYAQYQSGDTDAAASFSCQTPD